MKFRSFRVGALGASMVMLASGAMRSLAYSASESNPTTSSSPPPATQPSAPAQPQARAIRHIPTTQQVRADIQGQIEAKLGRPLSEAETNMIDIDEAGGQIHITLHQPLTGRLMKAIHDAKAASQPSTSN